MTTEKELGQALKEKQDEIYIEGDLTKKVIKIHATGKAAWAVAAAALAVAITATASMVVTAGTDAPVAVPVEMVSAVAAATSLGAPAALSAIEIGVAAGGIGAAAGGVAALNELRNYKLTKLSDKKIKLTKKK